MSGVVKKVADATFKVGKTIDWEGMEKLIVTDAACKEFSNLRRTLDEVNSQLQTKFSQGSKEKRTGCSRPYPMSIFPFLRTGCREEVIMLRRLGELRLDDSGSTFGQHDAFRNTS